MYIMVKRYQNSQLFGPDSAQELSILAVGCKQRGHRKSSSLTNGMGELETKVHLESMAKKARGLLSKSLSTPMSMLHPGVR